MAQIPFTLTHVVYTEGDVFGFFMALSSLVPLAVLQSCLTLALFRRDIWTICLALGLVANEVSNYALKHLLQHDRPSRTTCSASYKVAKG